MKNKWDWEHIKPSKRAEIDILKAFNPLFYNQISNKKKEKEG